MNEEQERYIDIIVPEIIPGTDPGTDKCQLVKWFVKDGELVVSGQKLALLETKKASEEVEAEEAGVISIIEEEGSYLKGGDSLGRINIDSKESKVKPLSQKEKPEVEPVNTSAALIKLFALVVLSFVVIKYGQPLMTQIADKSKTMLADKDKEAEVENPDVKSDETTVAETAKATPLAKSNVRITKGYEGWEPEIRSQLDEWVGEGQAYELTHIGVFTSGDVMEIRYRLINGTSSMAKKLKLKKDGIDDRFIFENNEGKEFLVYPPQ